MFLPANDAPGPGPKDSGLAALVDDSPQKRILTQKATPPPSPLLSELLKKGNLISASPRLVRANFSFESQHVKVPRVPEIEMLMLCFFLPFSSVSDTSLLISSVFSFF